MLISGATSRVLWSHGRSSNALRSCSVIGSRMTDAFAASRFSTTVKSAGPQEISPALQESYNRAFSEQAAHRRQQSEPYKFTTREGSGSYDKNTNKNNFKSQEKTDHWALYEGKIPVLEQDSTLDQTGKSSFRQQQKRSDSYLYGTVPRTSLLMQLTDRVGILHDVLRWFWKFDVNVCRIESRPVHLQTPTGQRPTFDFFVDFEGSTCDENVANLLTALRPMTDKLLVLDEKKVHWFPRHISELDLIAGRTLDAGVDLIAEDHPGFHDSDYRERRALLTQSALEHKWSQPIARIEYTPDEISVWSAVWDRMEDLWQKYACQEYLQSMELMKRHCGYQRDNIPQQQDISEFLFRRTGFRMRPVAGLLSSRDFLNGLAFRVFFSTQYIRHSSRPLYTPEPDICHELLGHAPMLADRSFADFSQEIGLASLGASDDDIDRLAHCYWHSVEFGLCKEYDQNGQAQRKAYGAGLLSSFGELEYACGDHLDNNDNESKELKQTPPKIKPWDPEVAARQDFPITTYQPVYFLAESMEDAKQRMRQFCEDLPRPFFALHNAQTDTVHIDRPVVRTKGVPDKVGNGK